MSRHPIPDCATCHGTGKTPCDMSFTVTHGRPARVRYGPCPVCMNGTTCPRCHYQGGMDEDDSGEPKCRFCGWSAESDRRFAREISA